MDTALHTACIQQYSESVKHAVFACALSIFAVQIAAVQCAAVKLGLAACSSRVANVTGAISYFCVAHEIAFLACFGGSFRCFRGEFARRPRVFFWL